VADDDEEVEEKEEEGPNDSLRFSEQQDDTNGRC
jgi:hypothetical protein